METPDQKIRASFMDFFLSGFVKKYKIKQTELTPKQYRFELCGSTYMMIFFNKYNTVNVFFYFLNNTFFSSLLYYKTTVYDTYNKIYVN